MLRLLDMSTIGVACIVACRQKVQAELIRIGLVDWLVSYLNTNANKMGDYALEYATALLMNLCLNSAGRAACQRQADQLIKLMIVLMRHSNNDVSAQAMQPCMQLLCMMHARRSNRTSTASCTAC